MVARACGLDRLVADFDLNGLTYYYRGLDGNANEELGAGVIVGNSLLTARGIPAAGEGDLKTCLAMLIMDRLGAGGSYTEFYAMDFNEDFVLMGHDGPGHVAIASRKPVLRGLGLYHGKRGYGISVEFNVKTGPITILGMTQTADGRLKLMAAEGESLPGPRLEIGNTNSRLKFALDPAEFMNRWSEQGPTHHCALGVGHQLHKIRNSPAAAWAGTGCRRRVAGPHTPARRTRGKRDAFSYASPPPRPSRSAVVDRIYRNGMTTLSGGNLSIRDDDDSIWITPAGVDKGKLTPQDIICVKPDGAMIGPQPAVVGLPFHRAIFSRRPICAPSSTPTRLRSSPSASPGRRRTPGRHPPGAAGVRRGRLRAVRGTGQRGVGRKPCQHLRRGLQRRSAGKPRHRTGGLSLLNASHRLETLDFCAADAA